MVWVWYGFELEMSVFIVFETFYLFLSLLYIVVWVEDARGLWMFCLFCEEDWGWSCMFK